MKLSEFFESDVTLLPKGGFKEGAETFDEFLSGVFERYIDSVKQIDGLDFPNICSDIKISLCQTDKLSADIVAAVQAYLAGHPADAYLKIQESLAKISIDGLISTLRGITPDDRQPLPKKRDPELTASVLYPDLYRMRVVEAKTRPDDSLKREDIFHLPFERRRFAHNQRYSIAGFPCLYLGSSTWICWDELGRPNFDNVFVSRFRFTEKMRVLDFQLPPCLTWKTFEQIQSKMDNESSIDILKETYTENRIISYILYWPLVAACSIKVECKDGSFFPQYIVPQLLLQWVTKTHKVDGIRHFSAKTTSAGGDAFAYSNCVFPTREIADKGQCTYLKGRFQWTSPIAWEMLRSWDWEGPVCAPANFRAEIRLGDDYPVRYDQTEFYKAEAKLKSIIEEIDD